MEVYSDLKVAAFESLAADPTAGVAGRFFLNATAKLFKIDDGTNIRSFLRNDQNLIFGNSGTASSNIRLNRAGTAVLQLVLGNDITAEGSLSTGLAQLSFRHEVYTDATKPAAGNSGRIIYLSDLQTYMGDNGTSYAPLGGGGAGGSLKWVESTSVAPLLINEGNLEVYSFSSGDAGNQALFAAIKIPSSYVSGRPVVLKLPIYSDQSVGTFILQTVATLIRVGVDAYSSVINQRTSTNTAITATVGNQNIPQAVAFDLTSTLGQINGVNVSPGDYIIVKLIRGSDTVTTDVRSINFASEVTLS